MRLVKSSLETWNLVQHPNIIVGLAGGTASGKTTLAKRIAERFGDHCLLISHDLYYLDVPNPKGHNYDSPTALDNDLLASHLDLLAAGKPAPLPVYNFATHSRQEAVNWVKPAPIVLLEGILILAIPALRQRCNYTVFVNAPDELRLERRITRDMAQRGRSREDVLAQYEATVRPMHELHVGPSATGVDLNLNGAGRIEDEEAILFQQIQSIAELRT
jgi:uridine kinase